MHEISWTDRRTTWGGVLLCVLWVVYFYALDHVVLSSAHFSPIFRRLLIEYDFKTAWLAAAVCFISIFWHRPAPIINVAEFLGRHPNVVALASVPILAMGSVVVYHACPLSIDEYAAVFQSKIFASGHLFAQLPRDLIDWLVVRGFNGSFLVASADTGRVIEYYWPGFALLLAPFESFRAPWLCNASLAGLAIALIYTITHEITGDRRAGGFAILFTIASGAFVADAISFYSMQAHMTANLLFVALLIKPTRYRALGAGLVGAVALILHNPVPHTLFALPWIVALAVERDRRRYLLPLLLGYLPGLAVGFEWLMFRSSFALGPHGLSAAAAVADGVFAWPDATLLNMRIAALAKLWLWATPCLFVIAVVGLVRYRVDRYARLLAQSAVLTFVAYCFVRFDQGHGWGYRYFQSAWCAIPILAGCAMSRGTGAPTERLLCFAGAAAVLNFFIIMPFQLSQIDDLIAQHLAQIPAPMRPGNNVYFIHPRGGFYVADMVQMDPRLRGPDWFLVSHGTEMDAQMIRRNWPNAVKLAGNRAADHWYLGSDDQPIPTPGSKDPGHFPLAPGSEPPRSQQP